MEITQILAFNLRGKNPAYISYRIGRAYWEWRNNLFFDARQLFADLLKNPDERNKIAKKAPELLEPVGYTTEEEAFDMPYNRRTGQWYPARRRGGYGNQRGGYNRGGYSRGYSPRRKRTYRRW